jgi:hypothetical protein
MTFALASTRAGLRASREWAAPAALTFAIVAVTARAGGAFLPSTWGWSALGPLLAAIAALFVLETIELGLADRAFLALLGALVLWTGLSAVWSDSVPRSLSEVERDLVYVSAVAALLLVATRRTVAALVGGTVAATTAVCGFGLAARLFPDRFGLQTDSYYRLARPLGYWNGMGLVAAMGLLLALGVAVSARSSHARAAASGATAILASTLYFTFSRGSWVALLLGLAVALIVAPNRARLAACLAALTPLLVTVVWLCSRFRALNDLNATLQGAARDGHRLALLVAGLALAAAVVPAVVERHSRHLHLSSRVWRRLLLAGSFLAVAVALVAVMRAGGPDAAWTRASSAFRASGWTPSTKLGDRLFSTSGRGRTDYWRVAWAEASSHRWLGSGAGTYDLYWTRDRPLDLGSLDAHSLYLETLAELGPVGLGLLCAFLAVPLLALRHARARPLVPAAGGAYVAFLFDAGLDWHWELPTVTLVALCCAAAVVVSARRAGSTWRVAGSRKVATLAALGALAVGAVVVQSGNNALTKARSAAAVGSYDRAAAYARRGMRLAPWSATPWTILAAAQSSNGDLAAARASLRRAIAKDPHDWHLWYRLAQSSDGGTRRAALAEASRLNPLAVRPGNS